MATPDLIREQPFERALPNSSEAERAILGATLLDNGLISQAIEQLRPGRFLRPFASSHLRRDDRLFERGAEINPILIGEELKKRTRSNPSAASVSSLTSPTACRTRPTFFHYAKVVRGKSMLRQLDQDLKQDHAGSTRRRRRTRRSFSITPSIRSFSLPTNGSAGLRTRQTDCGTTPREGPGDGRPCRCVDRSHHRFR